MYGTVEQLRAYLALTSHDDDALLELLLNAATSFIERYTRRRFRAVSETHWLTDGFAISDQELMLDDDLQELTGITDGSGAAVELSEVRLIPPRPPYTVLFREDGWVYPVSVTGQWGWSSEPPEDITAAAVRLAAYWYRLRDAQVFDVTAMPDQGVLTVPKGLPIDVKVVLDQYRRAG